MIILSQPVLLPGGLVAECRALARPLGIRVCALTRCHRRARRRPSPPPVLALRAWQIRGLDHAAVPPPGLGRHLRASPMNPSTEISQAIGFDASSAVS